MTDVIQWRIPPSMFPILDRTPRIRPVVLLLRHSVRGDLPPDDVGYTLPITDVGRKLARKFGAILGDRLRTLHTSPIVRCVQTAEFLRDGAGAECPVVRDHYLGDPGVYVLDNKRAGQAWADRGHESVMAHLVSGTAPLPGLARADEAARFLVQHMLAATNDTPGIHVFVTHDSLVTATAARLLKQPLGRDDWPWYLEGAFFWRSEDGLHTAYRDFEGIRNDGGPLCPFEETDVIEFACREVAATVGLHSRARFFLAGGAFKTLLTGKAPKDLDLWAPSRQDRETLIGLLDARGSRLTPRTPFADVFAVRDRVVEVARKIEPKTLEARLGRFDIAVSAIGAEYRPYDQWDARIHPLAHLSLQRRQVLLLKPLVNWKFALSTLERMHRYAEELNFEIPSEEVDHIWRVYDEQPPEEQERMIERYRHTGEDGYNIAEEALCRSR